MKEIWLAIDSCAAKTNLAPYGRTFAAVWFHGCVHHCPECIARNWNESTEPQLCVSPDFLAAMLFSDTAVPDGITISGGEPFMQAEGVYEFLRCADSETGRRMDVMLYTGYTLEELRQKAVYEPFTAKLLSRADILIDGRYIAALDDNQAYRGSSNQKIHFLTNRFSPDDFPPGGRSNLLESENGELALTGIPSKSAKAVWNIMKKLHPPEEQC